MIFRSQRRGGSAWQTILLIIAGAAVCALVLFLILDTGGDGGNEPSPTAALSGGEDATAMATATPSELALGGTPTMTPPETAPIEELYPTPSVSPTAGPSPTPTALSREAIEAAVREAVERFQEAKAYSQRTGDTSRLSEALAGSALERQIELVEQTKAAGCYWDISLDEPMRYEFLEVRDDYVFVRVYKTESRRYYCGGALASSELGDAYSTTYVVERIDGKWYVTERE